MFPTGGYDGQSIRIRIKQDGTGSRTLAYDTKYRFSTTDITTAVVSIAASKTDRLGIEYCLADDKWDVVSFIKGH